MPALLLQWYFSMLWRGLVSRNGAATRHPRLGRKPRAPVHERARLPKQAPDTRSRHRCILRGRPLQLLLSHQRQNTQVGVVAIHGPGNRQPHTNIPGMLPTPLKASRFKGLHGPPPRHVAPHQGNGRHSHCSRWNGTGAAPELQCFDLSWNFTCPSSQYENPQQKRRHESTCSSALGELVVILPTLADTSRCLVDI